jgi:hypothetical protein
MEGRVRTEEEERCRAALDGWALFAVDGDVDRIEVAPRRESRCTMPHA